MKNLRLIGPLLIILIVAGSCKSYKKLDRIEPRSDAAPIAEQVQKLKSGDKIKVFEKTRGSVIDMEFVSSEEGFLRGFESKGKKADLISIRHEDIARIEVKKFNVGRTALTTGGVISLVLVIPVIIAIIYFFSNG